MFKKIFLQQCNPALLQPFYPVPKMGQLSTLVASMFSTQKAPETAKPSTIGKPIKDQDRIFINLYKDDDPFIKGAMKRVPAILWHPSRGLSLSPPRRIFSSHLTTILVHLKSNLPDSTQS